MKQFGLVHVVVLWCEELCLVLADGLFFLVVLGVAVMGVGRCLSVFVGVLFDSLVSLVLDWGVVGVSGCVCGVPLSLFSV